MKTPKKKKKKMNTPEAANIIEGDALSLSEKGKESQQKNNRSINSIFMGLQYSKTAKN